ncbi:MAG: ABC transporter permease subunit [Lachnospiraceae bacterium]|nr:ABC transporter permease subunit [Lachnospiraceae bacterium]
MRNLMSAAWLRVRKNKVFWGAMILMAFFAVNSRLDQYVQRKRFGVEATLETSFFDFIMFASILMSVFISLFLGTEYGEGTIRNKIVVGHKRSEIYGSNLLICMMVNLLLVAAYLLPSLALGIPLVGSFRSGFGAILILFGCSILLLSAYTALYTAVAMVCQSRAVTAVICVLGVFLLLIAGIFIHGRLEAPEYYSPYSISVADDGGIVMDERQNEEPNPECLQGTKRKVYEFFLDFLPGGQTIQITSMSAPHLGMMALYSVLIVSGSTGIGLYAFYKKNIK